MYASHAYMAPGLGPDLSWIWTNLMVHMVAGIRTRIFARTCTNAMFLFNIC